MLQISTCLSRFTEDCEIWIVWGCNPMPIFLGLNPTKSNGIYFWVTSRLKKPCVGKGLGSSTHILGLILPPIPPSPTQKHLPHALPSTFPLPAHCTFPIPCTFTDARNSCNGINGATQTSWLPLLTPRTDGINVSYGTLVYPLPVQYQQ